ncbi:lipopolysaccharide biosynthesis protein [Luteimonas sp. Y-2-2-4F]|nr:lipopolysaccharide biosynthesis protein [Luteimonas sp. Y-2-2-4F]MCD9030297.1 lipopolysaccharide biosynthesis protein [Luteimonas sp. Y-2-2-4F]
MPDLLAICAAVAVATAALTWLARRYALWRRLLDEPGERRSHVVATPRGGGIAIVLALLPLLGWLALAPAAAAPGGYWLGVCAGTGLVAFIGWWDDHRPLSARRRFAVHLAAGALLGAAVIASGGHWLAAAVAFALAVGLLNVWNFMDGINGLAASQAAIAAAVCGGLAADPDLRIAAWALAAACCGFLPFNFPRARIFLGDVGSGALGYLLAALLARGLLGGGEVYGAAAAPVWLLLLSAPLGAFCVDASLTLLRRMLRGEAWWRPHVQHAYQAWARRIGHTRTTFAYAAWSVSGGLVAIALYRLGFPFRFMMLVIVAWQVTGGLLWFVLQDADRRMTSKGSPL